MDPPLAPTVRGPGYPPAPPSDHWYGGLGVSLGESEAHKPQKIGGCGWTRCPWNFGFEPRSPKYGPFLVLGCRGKCCAQFGPFFGRFSDIAELEGSKGFFVTKKSEGTWSVQTVSLPLAVLTMFRGCFGPKKAVLGHKMCGFGTSILAAPAPGRHRWVFG